jgi:response regulator receiver domain-containing protein
MSRGICRELPKMREPDECRKRDMRQVQAMGMVQLRCRGGNRRRAFAADTVGVLQMKILAIATLALICAMPLHAEQRRPSIILLVDDDQDDLTIQKYYLGHYDCLVTTTTDADEALKKLHDDWFDYAFVDLWLSGTTALDLIRASDPRNRRITFYVTSSEWRGATGSKMLLETMLLSRAGPYEVVPIVKGGLPGSQDFHSFAATLELLPLRRKA